MYTGTLVLQPRPFLEYLRYAHMYNPLDLCATSIKIKSIYGYIQASPIQYIIFSHVPSGVRPIQEATPSPSETCLYHICTSAHLAASSSPIADSSSAWPLSPQSLPPPEPLSHLPLLVSFSSLPLVAYTSLSLPPLNSRTILMPSWDPAW